MKKTSFLLGIGIILIFFLVGCSPVFKSEQSTVVGTKLLNNHVSLGQTFVAHYDGLSGINLYLSPGETGTGTLNLTLRGGSADSKILGTGNLPLGNIHTAGFYTLNIPPLSDSTQANLYLELQISGTGSVYVGTAPWDAYIQGALYLDRQPTTDQLSFNLIYQPSTMGIGLVEEGATWLGSLLLAFLLFIIPGWAVLGYTVPVWEKQDFLSKIALSAGVSIAIYPLLFLWTYIFNLHLGPLYAWLPPGIGVLMILVKNKAEINRDLFKRITRINLNWPDAAALFLLGMIFLVRFWIIRTLDTPIGSDSVHHTMITQLLVDHNGLMDSWLPYSDLDSFTYHFGFHASAAVFAWISRLPVLKSVLLTGQIFNGLAVLALYPLAKRLTSSKWSGVAAMLLAGLLFQMPMYYINWGRYTQLTSQIILPAVVLLIWDVMDSKTIKWSQLALVWITLAGLALTHYRVFLFGVFFFTAYGLINFSREKTRLIFLRGLWMALGSSALFLPWLVMIAPGKLSNIAIGLLSTPASETSQTVIGLKNFNYLLYLPGWAWLSLALAAGWGLWHKNREVAIISLWWFFTLAAANPGWLNLPGDGLLSHGAVITGFYIPASILIAVPTGIGIDKLIKLPIKVTAPLLLTLIIAAGFWGAFQRRLEILPEVIEVTRPDMKAMQWIRENTGPDARFLINAISIFYADWWYVGTDAGWWIPLLTQRHTTTQHMMYGVENEIEPGQMMEFNQLTQLAIDNGLADPEVLSILESQGITHLYIGQRKNDILGTTADTLGNNPSFSEVYHQDGVWVFEIVDITP